jgi:hypothetical protein
MELKKLYILWSFGIHYGHLLNLMNIGYFSGNWYIFPRFGKLKNLATLVYVSVRFWFFVYDFMTHQSMSCMLLLFILCLALSEKLQNLYVLTHL